MTDFNSTPYFDDYDAVKKFVRILFRPGFAVQTRELTQLQTILQNQISRLGDYNFEDGSIVTGGETQIDLDYDYVRLQAPPGTSIADKVGFRDIRIKGNTSNVEAVLVNYVGVDGDDPATLYVKYVNSGLESDASAGEEPNASFIPGETLTITVFDFDGVQEGAQQTVTVEASGGDVPAVGAGAAVSVTQGIRYVLGFFVQVDAQTIILDKYNNTPSTRIGFSVVESIVTEKDDPTLLDNALGSPNENAPGAHRYRIRLALKATEDLAEESFIEIVRLKAGKIEQDYRQAKLSKPGILEELAKRTYDANGNFIVENFNAEAREHLKIDDNRGKFTAAQGGDESLLAIDIDRGRAYVSGFEVTTTGQELVEISKGRDTSTNNNATISGELGAYILIDTLTYYPDIANFTTIDLKDAGTSVIGTARVRSLEFSSGDPSLPTGQWRLYVFDIRMTSGTIDDVASIESSTTSMTANTIADAGGSILRERAGSPAINLFPFASVASLTDVSYTVRKQEFKSTDGSGDLVISPGASGFLTTAVQDYSIIYLTGPNIGSAASVATEDITKDPGTGQVTISNLDTTQDVVVIYTLLKESPPIAKTKSKISTSVIITSDGVSGEVDLKVSDIIEVTAIEDVATGKDITSSYIVDDGQRDGYYGLGRLIPISGSDAVAPGDDVQVTFKYYTHGPGDYFTVDSYPDEDYGIIKTYTGSNGVEYDLRNAIDFRPRISNDGTGFVGVGSSKGEIYAPNTLIRADASYYLGRIDKIAVDETGNFFAIKGTPDVNPSIPKDSDAGMTIMEVTIPAYTFSPDDVSIDYVERKRYTMEDIGKLEDRIDNLEYYTALNLLEKDTADKKILDGAGDERFKNGFLVDDFSGHGIGDAANADYKCSVDALKGEVRPEFDANGIDLDIDTITGAVQTGDLITLPYTTENMATQTFTSKTEKINPNAVFQWEGDMKLSPDSATWFEKKVKPAIVSSNRNGQWNTIRFNSRRRGIGSIWGFWSDYWVGRPKRRYGPGSAYRYRGRIPFVYTRTYASKTVATGVAPFIQKRDIDFKAKNLRPNTRLFGFFDGVRVGTFYSDSKGKAEGTFTIPDPKTSDDKFRVGERVFRLMDAENGSVEDSFTLAEATFYATGLRKTRKGGVVSVREPKTKANRLSAARRLSQGSQPGNAVSDRSRFAEPLAQSFIVKESGGAFITDVNLYFKTKDPSIPVRIDIREVINGAPSQDVVPFSEVTVFPEDISVSTKGTLATNFQFESPVYLQEDTEYAIVINANTSRYEIFVSEIGENDLNSGVVISKQPFAGVLYKSLNSTSWVPEVKQDLKFDINKASFTTGSSATVTMSNSDLPAAELDPNPIEVGGDVGGDGGEKNVRVYHEDHGMFIGSFVTIAGVSEPVGGLDETYINGTHTITAATLDYYEFTNSDIPDGGGATTSATGGGTSVTATENARFDVLQPVVGEMSVPGTSSRWAVKGVSSGSFDGVLTPYVQDTSYLDIDPNDETIFTNPKLVASAINEQDQPELAGARSLNLRAVLSTDNPNLSPVIDVTRLSVVAIANRINEETTGEDGVSGGDAAAKYLTKKVSLANPAVGLKIYFGANRPQQATIKVYYKALDSDSDTPFDSLPWVEMTADEYPSANADSENFSEYEFSVDPATPFTAYAVKIVMLSSDSGNVPRVRDFRAIALGT